MSVQRSCSIPTQGSDPRCVLVDTKQKRIMLGEDAIASPFLNIRQDSMDFNRKLPRHRRYCRDDSGSSVGTWKRSCLCFVDGEGSASLRCNSQVDQISSPVESNQEDAWREPSLTPWLVTTTASQEQGHTNQDEGTSGHPLRAAESLSFMDCVASF